jgi:hypothetical protein
MEEVSGSVQKASTHASSVGIDVATVDIERDCATPVTQDNDAASSLTQQQSTTTKHVSKNRPIGAMEEVSGRVQKASTHEGGIGVDIAAVECDCAACDEDATSALPIKGSTSVEAGTPSGRWGGFMCRKRPTYILRAHKGAIRSTSVKASTPSGQWRKCQGEFNRRALTVAVLE